MTPKQREAIERHGNNLLAIFPDAAERDPVELCKRLRRLEARGGTIALRRCNGPEYQPWALESAVETLLGKVNELLCNMRQESDGCWVMAVPIFVNLDPRGYALKVDANWLRTLPEEMRGRFAGLHRDWGGYGILAPEIGKDGA